MLSVLGVVVPYIPTAKEKRTARFWKLARVPALLILLSLAAVSWTAYRILFLVSEGQVRISTEVTMGMAGFLAANTIFMSGRLYAAWKDRERPNG